MPIASADITDAATNAMVKFALVMMSPRAVAPIACPNVSAKNNIAVPAAEVAESMADVHAISDDVAAVNPHPNMRYADRATGWT